MGQTYYDILKIKQDATQEQIKKAYRLMMKKVHPDQNTEFSDEKLAILVKKARDVLISEIQRKKYDKELENIRKNETVPQLREQLNIKLKSEMFKQLNDNKFDNDNNFKYFRNLYNNLINNLKFNDSEVLKDVLNKLNNLEKLIKREINIYEQNNTKEEKQIYNKTQTTNYSTVKNEVSFTSKSEVNNSSQQPFLIEKQEEKMKEKKEEYINPIVWFDKYSEELKEELNNNKELSTEQIVELINYIQGLKQEFIHLLSYFSSNPEKLEQVKNNTIKLVEQKKKEMLSKNTELVITEGKAL